MGHEPNKILKQLAEDLDELCWGYFRNGSGEIGWLAVSSGWILPSQQERVHRAEENLECVGREIENEIKQEPPPSFFNPPIFGYISNLLRECRYLKAVGKLLSASTGLVELNGGVDNNDLYRKIQRECISRIDRAPRQATNSEKKILRAIRRFFTGRGLWGYDLSDIFHFRFRKDYLTFYGRDFYKEKVCYPFHYHSRLVRIINHMADDGMYSGFSEILRYDPCFYDHARRPIQALLKAYSCIHEERKVDYYTHILREGKLMEETHCFARTLDDTLEELKTLKS